MGPQPDVGEHSYRGTGRLTGRKSVVTGADSGMGRAVAIAFAGRAPTSSFPTYLRRNRTLSRWSG
ncbi:hypothetical protein [Micromonospora trifolii]|uniref:hypothetical protein n=1 Tax=Micromonospora trifolii TaxID=2911208 RepID=UPI0027DED41E|nr:hypothetical protein [Micromonospora trifolii]